MTEPVITVKNLSKSYKLYNSPLDRLKESLHPFRKKYHRDFYALKNISFEVGKGESIGIIGKNGSGKSTLLKILTGVLTPTSGDVMVNGKVAALLELGAGFNPEMTGVENVYMNGTLMGYTRTDMDAKLDEILSFADIGDFVHQPVKTYSSGMFVRLAFATQISVNPEVFIVDEALAVGDVFFQQKCFARIRENIDKGTTCLFVSHDTNAIMNICNSALLLSEGDLIFSGKPEEAVSRYYATIGKRKAVASVSRDHDTEPVTGNEMAVSAADIREHSILRKDLNRHGAGGLRIAAVRIIDENELDSLQVRMMRPLHIYAVVKAVEDVQDPRIGIHLFDRFGNLVFAAGNSNIMQALPSLRSGEELIVKLTLFFTVQPGDYTFNLQTGEPSPESPNAGFVHDSIEMLGPISVYSDINRIFPFYGIAQLPLEIRCGSPTGVTTTIGAQ